MADNAKLWQPLSAFIKDLQKKEEDPSSFFKEFFIVSNFELADKPVGTESGDIPGLFIHVERAAGDKCPRCWQWDQTDNSDGLCRRCQRVLGDK